MKLISIRSFRPTGRDYLREDGDLAYRTIASATLAIHKSLVERKHFAVNLTSLVPEDGDFLLVKVYAKTRTNVRTGNVDEFIEFPSTLVTAKSSDVVAAFLDVVEELAVSEHVIAVRRDIAHPITKQMRDVCTALVWRHTRALAPRARAA